MSFKFPKLKDVAIGIIGSFFLIQIISLLLHSIIPTLGILRGGPIILIMALGVGLMSLFIVGTNIESLKSKENLIFILITFGIIGLLYWKLESVFPFLFSIDPSISSAIKSSVGSIMGVGG